MAPVKPSGIEKLTHICSATKFLVFILPTPLCLAQDIPDAWLHTRITQAVCVLPGFGKHACHFAAGLVEITKFERFSPALGDTHRLLTPLCQVTAKHTLSSHLPLLVKINRIIHASVQTQSATNAFCFVEPHRPGFRPVQCTRGAHIDAAGIGAVLAHERQKVHFHIGEAAAIFNGVGSDALHPEAGGATWAAILHLASHRTGQTAYTTVKITDDNIIHGSFPPAAPAIFPAVDHFLKR